MLLLLLLMAADARVAIVVGSNGAAPGKRALRYAHEDARAFADTLVSVARFNANDVHVLYDPKPEALFSALRDAQGSLLFFYYSGHADEQAVYPDGKRVALADIRARLDTARADVKIGLMDACRGGGWTGSKGLTTEAPFEIEAPLNIGSEGTVFIASSTGTEKAHESDRLRGSFFTHHFAAGLRGAADSSGDGEISLSEAFAYARRHTVRDTAQITAEPQHPSFAMNLRGRQDLVLAAAAASPSSVEVEEHTGPLDVVHLDSGVTLLEIDAGQRTMKLGLPPGRYLLRRKDGKGIHALEVEVASGTQQKVSELQLTLVSGDQLSAKEPTSDRNAQRELAKTTSTPPAGLVRFAAVSGLGPNASAQPVQQMMTTLTFTPTTTWLGLELGVNGAWGITDRWTWNIGTASFAYRYGEHGAWELIPYGGITGLTVHEQGLDLRLGLGVDARYWINPRLSVIAGVRAGAMYHVAGGLALNPFQPGRAPSTSGHGLWQGNAHFTLSAQLHERVTLNVAVLYGHNFNAIAGATIGIGSVGAIGLQPLPLLQVHLTPWASLDAYLGMQLQLTGPFERLSNVITPGVPTVTALVGATFRF